MVAGLEVPSAGRILLDGADMTPVPMHKRYFGMVFQSLALFPHLNVADNIAYALRIRRVAAQDRRPRVVELLSLVHMDGYAGRPVAKLSCGQRPRVASVRPQAVPTHLFRSDAPPSHAEAT